MAKVRSHWCNILVIRNVKAKVFLWENIKELRGFFAEDGKVLFGDWARLPWYLLASCCLCGSANDERKHRFHWWLIFLSMSMSGWERGGIIHVNQAFSRNMMSNARPSGWKTCCIFSLGSAELFLDLQSTFNTGLFRFFSKRILFPQLGEIRSQALLATIVLALLISFW